MQHLLFFSLFISIKLSQLTEFWEIIAGIVPTVFPLTIVLILKLIDWLINTEKIASCSLRIHMCLCWETLFVKIHVSLQIYPGYL